ncbi:hypothetical protein Vadar_030170 [Vaccinium darrowii]|uniref:Uncharacterized protein n=1 Tax=Vaccinium darrowii TaxID=229202 RepID=A0ACB7Z080_9ERIC|nr:hypothetical protein Vadar_030170 [Vaccinium darrowii]
MGLVPYLSENGSDILTRKGQLFDFPDLFKQAIAVFAASNKFSFKFLDNSRAYYRVVCVVKGCPWKSTARYEGTELVRIISLKKEHVHMRLMRGGNAWGLRHPRENFSKFASSKGLKADRRKSALKLVNDLAYARADKIFKLHLRRLYGMNEHLGKWVEDDNPMHWSNTYFPFQRWDKMYTNLA